MVKPFKAPPGWRRVVFAAECDPYGFCPVCLQAGEEVDYADCPCPGPTQEDEFDYAEIQGVLYGRLKSSRPRPGDKATLPADQTGNRKQENDTDE